MVNPDKQDDEEKPLDPAMARVQARLQRLILIAGLTLGVGILAVFLAIIYRITASDDRVPVVAVKAAPSETAEPATDATARSEPGEAATAPPAPETDVAVSSGSEEVAGAPSDSEADAASSSESGETATAPVAPEADAATPSAVAEEPEPAAAATLPPVADPPSAHAEAGSTAPGTPAAVLAVEAAIPADARLMASTVAGGRIVLTYDHYGGTIVMVVDPETLRVVGRLDLKPQ
jgi:hypothetical protein